MIKGQAPSPQVVLEILDKLSTSHDFREVFLGDPAKALAEFGIEVDATKVPSARTLPPMHEIAALRTRAQGESDPLEKCGIWIFLLK